MSSRPTIIAIAAGVVVLLATNSGCARTVRRVETPGASPDVGALWSRPADLATRNLYFGAGGEKHAPRITTFEYVKGESFGSWGYDVKDAEGREWSVKLGREAQTEVAVSRLLWAIGYPQPPNYFLGTWTMTGKHEGEQVPGRFRLELPSQKVVGIWSWYENPFVGTREFAGLVVVNLLVNNWDWKTDNNKIYETQGPGGSRRVYMVRDLGASLGKLRHPAALRWLWDRGSPQGTKNDLRGFESQEFITGMEGGRIRFDYHGVHQRLLDTLTPADVRWACGLLNRLSREQMLDAFYAAGYDHAHAGRYVVKLRQKIAQGLAGTPSSPTPQSK